MTGVSRAADESQRLGMGWSSRHLLLHRKQSLGLWDSRGQTRILLFCTSENVTCFGVAFWGQLETTHGESGIQLCLFHNALVVRCHAEGRLFLQHGLPLHWPPALKPFPQPQPEPMVQTPDVALDLFQSELISMGASKAATVVAASTRNLKATRFRRSLLTAILVSGGSILQWKVKE